MEQGNAIQLSVVLFLSADNRCASGCTAADKQQGNPQQKIGVISRLRRLVGAGFDSAAGQLCRHGVCLGNLLSSVLVGEILLAAAAVPIRNVAFFGSGGGLCVNVFQVGVVVRVKAAVTVSTNLTYGLILAGRFAAGVLRVAVLSRVICHIAAFIGTFMPVMRCIGRPIGLPAVARGWNRLYFCCAALGAAICLFARFCAGRRCCYRTVVPSMRAYVILCIATGTLLPVHVIIMCPTGSKIMSQSIAIFRTANCAFCFFGAGGRAAGAVLCFHDIAGAAAAVFAVAVRCPVPIVGMFIALSLEHGQGLASCGQIFAFVCLLTSLFFDQNCNSDTKKSEVSGRTLAYFCYGKE